MRELRGEAEAAIAVEDWFAGVQALQSAVSLDPNNREVGARLRWAHDQRKVSGLFTEGQEFYESGKKSAALGRFRQVKVAAGNYRNVNDLIAQLEGEVAGESRRSTVRRWTAGAIAAVCGTIIVIGGALVWVVWSEFRDARGRWRTFWIRKAARRRLLMSVRGQPPARLRRSRPRPPKSSPHPGLPASAFQDADAGA